MQNFKGNGEEIVVWKECKGYTDACSGYQWYQHHPFIWVILGIYYPWMSYNICVTVFRPYRWEAIPLTTTRLPISLALNQTWPSVPLGPCPGCHHFSCQNAHTHHQVSLVVMSHPPHANSCLNFRIKVDPDLDLCLFWVDVDLDRTSWRPVWLPWTIRPAI